MYNLPLPKVILRLSLLRPSWYRLKRMFNGQKLAQGVSVISKAAGLGPRTAKTIIEDKIRATNRIKNTFKTS